MRTPIPRVRSQILAGSCEESIEPDNQDIAEGDLGIIEVMEGRLQLHFLNYKEIDGSPTAVVPPDFTELLFGEQDKQKQKRHHDHS